MTADRFSEDSTTSSSPRTGSRTDSRGMPRSRSSGMVAVRFRKRRRRRGLRAAVQDGFEVVGQQVMLLLPLFGDDLFRDASESIQIALRTRTDELPQ